MKQLKRCQVCGQYGKKKTCKACKAAKPAPAVKGLQGVYERSVYVEPDPAKREILMKAQAPQQGVYKQATNVAGDTLLAAWNDMQASPDPVIRRAAESVLKSAGYSLSPEFDMEDRKRQAIHEPDPYRREIILKMGR